ncbi:MAG TPA: NADH-quinone oxidoreductase subunit C, partial [Anaerohalosphaeraceae bacterium]|nr:NADH-quinone oxidoreductase subunit C [Anaerohalosphaeraceae bacterium]
MDTQMLSLYNCKTADIDAVPVLPIEEFRDFIIRRVGENMRIALLFGMPDAKEAVKLIAILADDRRGLLHLASALVKDSYPALTPDCPQAHWFEREIAEQFGVRPQGHPWLKPIRYHKSYTGRDAWARPADAPILPCVTDFFR